jgi:hypothetical protein
LREAAQREPELRRCRGLEGRQRDRRHRTIEETAVARQRHALDLGRWQQIDDETQWRRRDVGHGNDSKPAYFHLPGNGRRRAHDDVIAFASKFRLIVRHEASTLVDQAQCKIRFARARWASEQNAFAPKRNRRAVDSDHAAL